MTPDQTETIARSLGLEPANLQVEYYPLLGRAVAVLPEGMESPTLFRCRDASRQSGWDIEITTGRRFRETKERALQEFASVDLIGTRLAHALVACGVFSFDDLSVIPTDKLAQLGELDTSRAAQIIGDAEGRYPKD